jgi:hypothetical protein
MPELSNPRPDSYFVWEPPNHNITILLNLRLLQRMKLWMDKGLEAGNEVGGILLGRIEQKTSGESVVTVDDCEAVEIDHQRGLTYTLNDHDKRQIARRIEWWQSPGRANTAVGFVRSHARAGLYLDAADFAMFQNSFPGPRSVFLLARPGVEATGGFYFWESDDVHRQSTYLQFPFDRERLESGGYTILRPTEHAGVTAKAIPVFEPKAQPPAENTRTWGLRELHRTGWAWLLGALLVLLLTIGGWYWSKSGSVIPITSSAGFGLNIDHVGRALRLTWDTRTGPIRHANQGTLWIRDGGIERKLLLNARQIEHGSALYVPASSDVEFRLQVPAGNREIADSIRSVGQPMKAVPASIPLQTNPPEVATSMPPPAEPATRPPAESPRQTAPEERRTLASQTARVSKRTGSADRARSPMTAATELKRPEGPQQATAPSEHLKVEPAPAPEPAVVPAPASQPQPPPRRAVPIVNVSYEAAPESSIRRKIQKVPGLRLFQHFQYRGGDDFAPARAVREVRPQLRMSVVRALPGEWRVELRIGLDKHGRVTEVESLSTEVDERLVTAAVSAVRQSEFEPAQLHGRDVSSRLLVTFHFRNPPQNALASATP